MMTQKTAIWHAAASAAIILTMALPARTHADEVTVTVSVATTADDPIAGVPIQAYSDDDVVFGFTDEAGAVTFTIELDPNDPDIVARLWDGTYHLDLAPEERVLAHEQYKQFSMLYHFKAYYFAQTAPGVTQYQIDIVAQPSVRVTGRLVDAIGAPIPDEFFAVGVRGGAWFGEFLNTNGDFTVHGVPRGAVAEVALVLEGPETRLIQLSAAQTMQDVDLGDVAVQLHERPVPLSMTVTNAEGLYDPGDVALWTHVSLIRNDAQVLLTFPIKPPSGEVVAEVVAIQTDVPRTTEGVYYIVPGPIAAPTALVLLDAIRNGQHAQLDNAGVPKVTCVTGEVTTIAVHARHARDAIYAATGGP